MRQIGCYRGLADSNHPPPQTPLSRPSRAARAFAGLAFIASVGLLWVWPLAALAKLGLPGAASWLLAAAGLWLGVSHLVASVTGYLCGPEVGAIASLLMRRQVITTCAPWERLDRRIERHPGRRTGEERSPQPPAPLRRHAPGAHRRAVP